MNKKLTLSVDDAVIEKTKKYAGNHKESLSELVEAYFRIITSDEESGEETAQSVKALLGSVKVPSGFSYIE